MRTPDAPWWPDRLADGARPSASTTPGGAITLGAPIVADLDGDGQIEVVVTDTDGNVWAWQANGRRRSGFTPTTSKAACRSTAHVDLAFSRDEHRDAGPVQPDEARLRRAQPAAADLDGDGRLEIVGAALDRHVYAWHDDGTPVAGFPVLAVDPAKVAAIDPASHRVTFAPDSACARAASSSRRRRSSTSPATAARRSSSAAQEEYEETPNIGDGASVLALLGA